MIATAQPDLAVKFAGGDPDGVRAVYRRYGRFVFAVAFKLLGDHGLAEEATQQTFVSAWRAAANFDVSRELGPWLATIARRTAIDIRRRESRRPVGVALEEVDPSAPELVTRPVGIETTYEIWEVRRALDELPEEERRLIHLAHFEGLSHVQIAARLDLPVGTVKSRTFRAHRRLAGLLGHLREPSAASESDSPAHASDPRQRGKVSDERDR
jgi:RNA polymerase sigma factor (sigma-70 family)